MPRPEPSFAADPYVRQRQARSILCLPLINQAKLIGVLYLENNLDAARLHPGPDRGAEAACLAGRDLAGEYPACTAISKNAKPRSGGWSTPILSESASGTSMVRFIEANDAFLRMWDTIARISSRGRLSWTDLTPPEWRDRMTQAWHELKATGSVQPYEKEYFRKDGSRVPVLVGAASFEESGEPRRRLRARFDRAQAGRAGAARQ